MLLRLFKKEILISELSFHALSSLPILVLVLIFILPTYLHNECIDIKSLLIKKKNGAPPLKAVFPFSKRYAKKVNPSHGKKFNTTKI